MKRRLELAVDPHVYEKIEAERMRLGRETGRIPTRTAVIVRLIETLAPVQPVDPQ